jgi:hypothetical protein
VNMPKKIKQEIIKKNPRGQPPKAEADKKNRGNGLRGDQIVWLKEYASARNLPSLAEANRVAVDWFITAIDGKRGDVTASAIFDDMYKEVNGEE